jgi:peptidoglycan hydrolase-like protein with peptidoglycan-binding domain
LVTKTGFLYLVVAALAWPAAATTTHKPKPKAHATRSVKAQKSKPSKVKSPKGKSAKRQAPKRSRRSSQQAPTPDRYKEIQQALAGKGYLHSEPNGKWDADSTDALKRFQGDQNLTPDGKINSLSLIALGLGPKRLTAQAHPAVADPPKPEAPKTDIPE